MKCEGAKHATNACVNFFTSHAMYAMCIFCLVFYRRDLHFGEEIIGLHITVDSLFFLDHVNN